MPMVAGFGTEDNLLSPQRTIAIRALMSSLPTGIDDGRKFWQLGVNNAMARADLYVASELRQSLELHPDEFLVDRAKVGDETAFAELCQRHSGMATRMINRIVRNNEDTEDVLQEATLKAYLHLNGFDGRAKFSTWFTKISVNSALMFLRKKKSRPSQSLEDFTREEGGEYRHFSDGSPSPESIAVQSQLAARLNQAIRRLPPVLRDVTEIRQSGDFSIEEVAGIAGLTLATTKSRLLRARKMLSVGMIQVRRTEELGARATQSLR